MRGPLGETAGKNGRPELPEVTSPTVVDLLAEIDAATGGREWTMHMGRVKGLQWARIECGGLNACATGGDMETVLRQAIMRAGMLL